MKTRSYARWTTLLVVGGVAGAALAVPPKSGRLIVKEGDTLGSSTVSTVGTPFTDGNGKVGFAGGLADNQRYIWYDSGPVFFSNNALPDVLTGHEGTMGISNTGGFLYSPNVNGGDAVYSHAGLVSRAGDPLPGVPGRFSTTNSRPHMLPDGTAYWMASSSATSGGSSTNRHLMRATDVGDPSTISAVFSGGDTVQGKTIATDASQFEFWFSDNNQHHIHVLDMANGSTANDIHLYVDGAFEAQEGQPTGAGDNWASFNNPGINNSGNYIFSADTSSPAATDQVLAYNGEIAIREGDTLDGIALAAGFGVRAAAINDLNQVAHIWGTGSNEHLFFGDGAALEDSLLLLSIGDELDMDDDGFSDYVVKDFTALVGPGLDLAENGRVYVGVDLQPVGGTGELAAIISVAVPEPTSLLLLGCAAMALRRRHR